MIAFLEVIFSCPIKLSSVVGRSFSGSGIVFTLASLHPNIWRNKGSKMPNDKTHPLRPLDSLIVKLSDAELTIGLVHYMKEMERRGLSADAQIIIEKSIKRMTWNKSADGQVAEMWKDFESIIYRTGKDGKVHRSFQAELFLDVFKGREFQEIDMDEFVKHFKGNSNPRRAATSQKKWINDRLGKIRSKYRINTRIVQRGTTGRRFITMYSIIELNNTQPSVK